MTDFPIAPRGVRYIKLGPAGRWAEAAIGTGKLVLDFREIEHELAVSGNDEALASACLEFRGGDKTSASTDVGEIRAFYEAGEDELWIAFHAGKLWWAFAKEGVSPSDPAEGLGARYRRTLDGWRSTDANGSELAMRDLDGRITQLAGYRRTICSVKQADRVVRLINGAPRREVAATRSAHAELAAHVATLVCQLGPDDFEVLVDLIVTRLGWRRVGAVGGLQKTVDIEIEQPLTGERAFVQVKSRSTQTELDGYVAEFERYGVDRMIYAWHSGPGLACDHPGVILLGPEVIANNVVSAGLLDWLIRKTR